MRTLVRTLLGYWAIALLTWATFGGEAIAQSQTSDRSCQLDVGAGGEGASRYRWRENRCEGVYTQKVSGRVNLRIVGYHYNRLEADIGNIAEVVPIQLRVLAEPARSPTQLTVISLRPTDYYQMDTTELAADGSFSWDTRVLRQLEYPPRARHLAALACTAHCDGDDLKVPMLSPVVFQPEQTNVTKDEALVLVMADVDLSSLKARLTVDGEDKPRFDEEIRSGFLPAKSVQRLIVKELNGQSGLLTLTGHTHSGRRVLYEARLSSTGLVTP